MFLRISQAVLCLSLALSASACAKPLTDDIKTQSEADPRIDFSGMKTYAWAPSAGVVNDPQELWTPPSFDVGAELTHLINDEMHARGWAESAQPDMAIAFLVVNDIQELKVLETERAGEVPDLVGVGQGALLLEIMDASTGRTIWLAAATAESQTGRKEEDIKKRLAYAVKQLFKDLPR